MGDGWTYRTMSSTSMKILRDDLTVAYSPGVKVCLRPNVWRRDAWVRLTAQLGWAQTPPAVPEAVFLQANRIFNRRSAPLGDTGPAEWGLMRLPSLDPDVKAMLGGYRKVSIA